jgi:hypothetical protein
MKLFQRLLVAPAALGLLSPLAANATEVNLNDISNYSDVESIELANAFDNEELTKSPLLAGGEGLVNGPDGGFSETSTVSFSVKMAVGAVDGLDATTALPDGNQTVQAQYAFDTKIKTSFTGDDSLEVAIDSGSTTAGPVDEFGLNNTADALKVDGVAYKFPIGDSLTAMVADNKDGSSMFTVACAYGGPSDTLDDCGNVNAVIDNGGAMAGAEYDFGNGFTAAIGYAGNETDLMAKEGIDAYGANAAYTGDNYGVSVTYGLIETGTYGVNENTYTALNGYYSFDNGLNVSAGYEFGDIGGAAASADESINYFLGLNGEVGPGELGAALGTSGGQIENQTEELMYEVYYSYPLNDGMTITPLVFIKEKAATTTPDQTGIMVLTSFKF